MSFTAFERYRRSVDAESSAVTVEEQSSDYESGRVQIASETWRLRTARITPTKPGAFVAVWTRAPDGGTQPFDVADGCAGLLVFVGAESRFGVFTFTRAHLEALRISRSPHSPGKRGFRVYPPWSANLNSQATRTQRAQAAAFVDLSDESFRST